MKKNYKVAGYIRLSSEKETSKSIENQELIIKNYVNSRADLELSKLYIDKNLSGTSFERKEFQQMTLDIENRKIDCVVVCDLSRLGRDFISVGYYVENFFPKNGVRFISISDKFETLDGVNNISEQTKSTLEMPLKALLDEQYSVDVKNKTNATLKSLMLEGKFIGSKPPFGYKRDASNKHKLVIDENAVGVVKLIFDMASEGTGVNEIVRTLNNSNVPTPSDDDSSTSIWNSRTIKKMLCNRTYAGDLEQGKDNILVLNTHEAIVNRDTFLEIQKKFENNKARETKAPVEDNPLKGKVICGTCDGKMQRRRGSSKAEWYFYSCITNNRKGSGCDTGMYIRVSEIETAIQKHFGNDNISTNLENVSEILIYKNGNVEIK